MSNEAYLLATDTPGPVGIDDKTHVGYDPRTCENVAHAPLAVPVYWLALFNASHLATLDVAVEDGDFAIPSLVAKTTDAKRLLRDRRDGLTEFFPEFQPTWDQFASVIDRLKGRFLKAQLQELWEMEGDDFLEDLEAAQRWFETGNEDDFAELLELASIKRYDKGNRTFPSVGKDVPRAFHLRGYAEDDRFWDNTSDL